MTPPRRPPAILDTNVASFVFGNKPEAALYEADCKDRLLFLSFQTIAEMLAGAEIAGWGRKRRADLAAFLDFYEPVYCDEDTVATWAKLRGTLKKRGKTLSPADCWIAATALSRDLSLIAHDGAFREVPDLKLVCHAPS